MKKMGLGIRFILTGCFILGMINIWTYYDPITAWKKFGSWNNLSLINNVFGTLYAIASIYILIRIVRNPEISKSDKSLWFIGTLLLTPIIGSYYIWIKEK